MTDTNGFRIDVKPPRDREIPFGKRDRITRILVALWTIVLVTGLPYLFVTETGGLITSTYWGAWLFHILGVALGGYALTKVSPYLYVLNPEWTAYLTQNPFGGAMIPYGSGFHPTLPWEQRNKRHNYSLKIKPLDIVVPVQTKTAKIDAVVHVQYQGSLPNIDRAVGSNPTTIKGGITAFISSFLTGRFGGQTADYVIENVKLANTAMAEFMGQAAGHRSQFTTSTGYRIVSATVNNFVLPTDVQKTRDAVDEAEQLHLVIEKLLGLDPGELARRMALPATDAQFISYDKFQTGLNRAMATSNNAEMKLNVIEGNIPEMFANLLGRLAPKKK